MYYEYLFSMYLLVVKILKDKLLGEEFILFISVQLLKT